MSKSDPDHFSSEGHERRDVSVRAVTGFGIGLAVCILVIFVAIWGMLKIFNGHRTNDSVAGSSENVALPPEPRLQADPAKDLASFRERESALLYGYAWVDRKAGLVRVPIDQAIDRIVQRGLPEPPLESIGKTPLEMRQSKGLSGRAAP